MDFVKCSKRYLNFNYFFGISSYRPDTEHFLEPNRFIAATMKYLQFAVCISLATFVIVKLNIHGHLFNFRQTEILLITTYVSFDVLRGFIVLIDCLLYRNQMVKIILTFQKLQKYFVNQLDHHISYEPLVKRHLLNIILILLAFIFYIVIFVSRLIVFEVWSSIGIPMRFLQLIQALTFLHITFYIDALCFHLAQLNAVVQRDTDFHRSKTVHFFKSTNILGIQSKLKCYKTIHFELWETAEMLNIVFGWCTITLLMHVFIDLVYSAFWLFDELNKRSGILKAARKWMGWFFETL